ncbi:30S ribosomal protein S25e [Candidatus Bathyarchaeota archaeon]|nr:30S ribosomal protein S25e [Candidatus Bathyarchaeota archaeon]
MGGKKKLGLKQMERMQEKKDEESKAKDKKKDKAAPPKERRTIGVIPPDVKNAKIVSEVKKMNVLTPYAVASRFNVRISAAKDFLEQLEQIGAVEFVSGNHNIKIYKPVAA